MSAVDTPEDAPTPGPKRTWRSAPARVLCQEPGSSWIWLCNAKHTNMRPGVGVTTALAGYPSMADAITGLTQHHRDHHPGPTFVALAAAHMRRLETAYAALLDSGLVEHLDAAGVEVLEAVSLLAQDPRALAAVRALAQSKEG